MADTENAVFDQDEIEKLFNKGKTSGDPYAFAFGLAAKPEDCGLLVHLRKPPATLKKDLKGSSKAIRKVCFGTFTMDGSDVLFAAEKPLKGLVKQLKKKFRAVGMGKYRPVLVGPDGEEIDEEGLPDETEEDEDEESSATIAAEAPATAEKSAPDTKDLRERLIRVKTRIEGLPKDKTGQLVQAFIRVVGLVKEGKVTEAGSALNVIEKALVRMSTEAPAAAPPEPSSSGDLAAQLTAALSRLAPRLQALPPGPVQTALVGQIRSFQGLIVSGDTVGATAALRSLAEALVQAEASAVPSTSGSKPQDIWNAAKETVDEGLAKLQSALRSIRHPDTQRIAEFGLAGVSGGQIQTKMMTALLTHTRAGIEDRAKAAASLRGVISEYRAFLRGNRLVALCDENPFGVTVNLRSGLGEALDRIEETLAA